MFPGLTTKLSEETLASAATISPKADLVRVTGTAAIANITPNFGGGFSGVVFLVAIGLFTWTVGGNIAVAGNNATSGVGSMVIMVYSKSTGLWYPSRVA